MRSTRLCGLIVALVVGIAAPAGAQTFTLSGTVDGGGTPLAGAIVRALQDNTTSIVASAATNTSGAYSVALEPGIYDISVVPAFGSGFDTRVIQNVSIEGDTTLDVTLFATTVSTLSGTVRGRNGQAVPNVFVRSTTFTLDFVDTFTDAAGRYSVSVGDGTVFLAGSGLGPAGVAPPSFSFERFGIVVSGPTIQDVDLPIAELSGTVFDPSANPVSGATVQIGSSLFDETAGYSSFASLTTDSLGHYAALLIAGNGNVTATPPSGSPYLPVSDTFTLTADAVKDLTLGQPVALSGIVRGRNGQGIPDVAVSAFVGGVFVSTTTSASGTYSLQVPVGTAILVGSGNGPDGVAPASFSFQRFDIPVTGATVVNVDLPVVILSGRVLSPSGTPLEGATVDAATSGTDGVTSFFASVGVFTDSLGAYSTMLVAGTGNVTARPPSGTSFLAVSQPLELAGDTAMDLTLGQAVELSGTLRGRGGAPIPDATVRAFIDFNQLETTTDSTGHYTLGIPPGMLTLQISGSGPAGVAPPNFTVQRSDLTVTAPTTVDFDLTTAEVTVYVTDTNGLPLPNVTVDAGVSSSDATTSFFASASAQTDSQGALQYLVITGDAGFTVFPPAKLSAQSFLLQLTGDATLRFAVGRADGTPPVITAGPAIVHLSDTSATIAWTTDEASTSTVDFGVSGSPLTGSVTDGTLTTKHMITLQGLDPLTSYDFTVASIDEVSNGPTVSGVGTFRTLASPGDMVAPMFKSGPTVVSISDTAAFVQWTTDEPAGGLVEYGDTPVLGSLAGTAAFNENQLVLLSGLLPSTTYYLRVSIADPNGNFTTSAITSFVTASAPDTTPPSIVDGPTIVDVTDTTITVRWTTNEPASSGVSFNDGAIYDLLTDSTAVTEHVMTLVGLTPGSQYFLNASSTDVYGNGPTLSATVTATTDATPDTTGPVISGAAAVDRTQTTAAIVWTTDEPATSEVAYGTVSGFPDDIRASLTRTTTHKIELNGLQPSTEYFTVIRSTDAAGNPSTFDLSFHTAGVCGAQPPAPAGPLTGPASPTRLDPFTIAWAPSPDEACIVTYEVLRNGMVIATVDPTVHSIQESGLADGPYEYVVRATDTAAQTSLSAPLTIVVDRTEPVLSLPGPIQVDSVSTTGEIVTFVATAVDAIDGPVAVTCTPASGSLFPFGTTTVSCSAQDTAGNVANGSFTVTVRDVAPPVIATRPDIQVQATSPAGAVVTYTNPTATDNADPAPVVTCVPPSGSTFPLGTTVVTCTATDASGNHASSTFKVKVVDTIAPVITSVTPSQTVLWPPNHQPVPIFVSINATDAVSTPQCRISAVSSNEPINGSGDGNTWIDWLIVTPHIVLLRAERSAHGNGRIYTITVTCRDNAGNSSSATTTVKVPKNKPPHF